MAGRNLTARRVFLLLAASALLAAVLAARGVYRWQPLPVAGRPLSDGYVRVSGVVHVHTTRSDGAGSPEEAIAAARAAGLRFLVITDHNNLDAKSLEGYQRKVLVLVGTEISTTAGHILGLGIPDPVFRFSGDGRDGLEDVRDLGGFAFAAHPQSPREDLRFTGGDLPGSWGMELVNGDSDVRAAGGRLLATAGLYALNPRYALLRSLVPPDSALARWDGLLRERKTPGIAGADAHGRLPLTRKWTLRIPSYESVFSLLRVHVLLPAPLRGDPVADARAVLEALGHGRAYVGLDGLAPAGEFSFTVEGQGRRWTMGDEVPAAAGLKLRAAGMTPAGTRLRLLRDGKVLAEADRSLELPVPGPGVYRVEARVPGWDVPWILTNPVYVFDPVRHQERARRSAWPPALPVPTPAVVLDSFEGQSVFSPEFDPTSSVEAPTLDSGPDGSSAGRLAFRLGSPGPGRPHTWCALVNREARDLSGRSGLLFAIRADGVYRLWIQVRDRNPASPDEGTEWWFTSVKTSTQWRRVALPFSRFRSISPHSDGNLDLDQVQQLVFVVEPATVKAGTTGTIWLDDVGVY